MNSSHILSRILLSVILFSMPTLAQTWMQTTAPGVDWKGVACSTDGNRLVAVVGGEAGDHWGGGYIYLSTNAGASWFESSAPKGYWNGVASSADGTKLVAVAGYQSRFIYVSTDSGLNWTLTSAPHQDWGCVASSADGTKLVAGGGTFWGLPGQVYTSWNSGTTWQLASLPTTVWRGVAMSSDGSNVVLAPSSANTLYPLPIFTSTNAGDTWISNNLAGPYWSCAASSADGSRIAIGAESGGIRVSTNAGATWMPNLSPDGNFQSLACSADVSVLVGVTDYGPFGGPGVVYSSVNGGLNWTSNNVSGDYWQTAAVSADGTKWFVAGFDGPQCCGPTGKIFTTPPEVLLSTSTLSNNLVVSWPTNAVGFALQASPRIETTNWVALTNSPAITNGRNQIILTPTNGTLFLRLRQ